MQSHSSSSLAAYNAQRRYEQQYKALSAKLSAQDSGERELASTLENVQRECRRLQASEEVAGAWRSTKPQEPKSELGKRVVGNW